MGLEIQGAVNSIMASANQVHAQNEENKRKALNIALGAMTGGVGGAITAAAKQAGINSKAVGQLTNTQTDILGDVPVQQTPQIQAAQRAYQSMSAEQERIKAQKSLIDQFKELSKEDRTQFLKESQHYQAQQKRGGK